MPFEQCQVYISREKGFRLIKSRITGHLAIKSPYNNGTITYEGSLDSSPINRKTDGFGHPGTDLVPIQPANHQSTKLHHGLKANFAKNGPIRGIYNNSPLFDCQLFSNKRKGNKITTELNSPYMKWKQIWRGANIYPVPYGRPRVVGAILPTGTGPVVCTTSYIEN